MKTIQKLSLLLIMAMPIMVLGQTTTTYDFEGLTYPLDLSASTNPKLCTGSNIAELISAPSFSDNGVANSGHVLHVSKSSTNSIALDLAGSSTTLADCEVIWKQYITTSNNTQKAGVLLRGTSTQTAAGIRNGYLFLPQVSGTTSGQIKFRILKNVGGTFTDIPTATTPAGVAYTLNQGMKFKAVIATGSSGSVQLALYYWNYSTSAWVLGVAGSESTATYASAGISQITNMAGGSNSNTVYMDDVAFTDRIVAISSPSINQVFPYNAGGSVGISPAATTYGFLASPTITYSYSGTGYGPTATAPTEIGSYTVTATATDAAGSKTSSAVSFSIAGKGSSTISLTNVTNTFVSGSATQFSPTVSTTGSAGVVTYSYSGTGATSYGPTDVAPSAIGTYTCTATVAEDASYYGASSSAFSYSIIDKYPSSISMTGSTSFVYTGSAQGPATSTVSGSAGAVTYSYSGTGLTSYSASATPPSAVGTYSVTAKVASAGDYASATSAAYAFSILAAPTTYNFEADAVGATTVPANVTVVTATAGVEIDAADANNNVFKPATTSSNMGVANLDLFPATADYSVTWKEYYGTTTGKEAMLLRASGTSTLYAGAKQGYYFMIDNTYVNASSVNQQRLRVYRLDASTQTQLGSAVYSTLPNTGVARWYKATVQGSTLKFEYSTDGITFTTAVSTTDATFTAGTTQCLWGFSVYGNPDIRFDDIAFQKLTAKPSSSITISGSNFVPNSAPQGPSISTSGSTGTLTSSYSGIGSTTYGPSGTQPTDIGSYQVLATLAGDVNYDPASAISSFTLKNTSTISVIGTTSFTYSGIAQGPVSNSVTGSTGAVTYSYSGTGATTYGPLSTPPTVAGTYQVIATVAEDPNFIGASSSPLAFTINKAPNAPISVSGTQSFVANSSAQGPSTITYTDGGTTSLLYTSTDGGGYSSATAPTNVGAYQVVASATEGTNYTSGVSSPYTFTIYPVTSTFSKSGSSNWSTATEWTYAPLAATDLVISSGELVVDQTATVHSITVAPGAKLTINTGSTLTASSITLQSSSSGTATLVDADATGSTITAAVQQYLPTGRNWYIGIPFTDVSAVNSSTLLSAGATSVSHWNEATGSWVNTYSGAMSRGKGYIAVSASGTATNNISFSGTLNTGSVPVAVTRTVGVTKEGFNLIANPYPSYLNPCAVITASTKMEPTIWYRTKGTSYQFETVNTTSGEGTNGVTGYIPPMQAFWVRVKPNTNPLLANSEILTFTNAMRFHANPTVDQTTITTTAMKAPSATKSVVSKLRLVVSNGINSDETLIYTNTNASNSYDMYDSQKMSNANPAIPEIYTLVGSENLVINGLNSIEPTMEIPLGFTTGQNNMFSVTATELSNFEVGTQVILKDNELMTETNLTNGSAYTFSSDATTTASRFSVIFRSASVATGIDKNQPNDPSVVVFRNSNSQIVVNCNSGKGYILVYNTIGQKLTYKAINNTSTILEQCYTTGVYFVSVITDGKIITRKIIVD